jgi:hypothetical protein
MVPVPYGDGETTFSNYFIHQHSPEVEKGVLCMMNEDFNRAPQAPQARKPFTPNRYSNSGGYNYSYNNQSQNQNQGGYNGGQQHPRRRTDRFKRESLNVNDKIAHQNDIIIRLLKEIRDRLPPPPAVATEGGEPGLPQEQNAGEQQPEMLLAQNGPQESVPEVSAEHAPEEDDSEPDPNNA